MILLSINKQGSAAFLAILKMFLAFVEFLFKLIDCL